MPKLYTRRQGSEGAVRYYADLRDIGLGQHALKPSGDSGATTDPVEAQILMGRLIERLTTQPRAHAPAGGSLAAVATRFLKVNPGGVTEKWLEDVERRLRRAVEWFGAERPINSIEPRHVREWTEALQGKGYANGTVRHHLHALSSVYRYGMELGEVLVGQNPVAGLYRKPSTERDRKQSQRAKFLEVEEAARFLAAAERLDRVNRNGMIRFEYPLLATFLLTGGRRAEVFGLEVDDIDFEHRLVHIRPNSWRGLKRRWSERSVPLWPQLDEILRRYLDDSPPPARLLFPSPRLLNEGGEGLINNVRKTLRDVAQKAAIPAPSPTMFRHTYATTRLQTTDNGMPISVWTVGRELGHKGIGRIEDTYGHLSTYLRARWEVVEYRVTG